MAADDGDWRATLFFCLGQGPWSPSVDGGALAAARAFDGVEVRWRGHYLLDNGDGLEKVSDGRHECLFALRGGDGGVCVAVARGRGLLRDVDGGMELTLARRYVRDSDPRKGAPLRSADGIVSAGGGGAASASPGGGLCGGRRCQTATDPPSPAAARKGSAVYRGAGGGGGLGAQ
eukprot:gene47343-11048_t